MTLVEPSASRVRLGIIVAFVSAIVFGVYPVAARAVYADGGNAVFLILATTAARALSLAFFCVLKKKHLFATRDAVQQAFIGGAFQATSILGIFMALSWMSGPLVVVIVFTNTLMLLFFMMWRGEIKIDALTIILTALALFGLSLILDVWFQPQSVSLLGMMCAGIAAVATASRLYVYGRLMRTRDPAIVGAEAFLCAFLFGLLVLAFKAPQLPVSLAGYGWAAVSAGALAVGTFGMFYGIALLGSFRFSLVNKSTV